jgi:hypothetical protein
VRYITSPSAPSAAEVDVHMLQRWHFLPWVAPVARALLGRSYVEVAATVTLSTDGAGRVARQAESYGGAWARWGLWWPVRLAVGLAVPLWSTLLLGY